MLKNNGKYFKLPNLIKFAEILISLNLKEIQDHKIKMNKLKIIRKNNLFHLTPHLPSNIIKRPSKNRRKLKTTNKYKLLIKVKQ